MVKTNVLLIVTALGAALAPGQSPKVFHLTYTETPQQLQEIATVIRSIAEIRQLTTDAEQKAITMDATPAQASAAEWLIKELDKPISGQRVTPREYVMAGEAEDIIRVFYLTPPSTVLDLQETATVIRSILEMRRAFTYNAPRAIILRGTAPQIAAAEWVFNELNQPSKPGARHQYTLKDDREGEIRTLFLAHAETSQQVQELATAVRATTELRRLFTHNGRKAVILRSTLNQVTAAEWLVNELDQPAGLARTTPEHRMPGDSEGVIRVFYLSAATAVQRLQEMAAQVRTASQVRRLFTCNAPRAMIVRGTADQLASAERLVEEAARRN